MKSLASSKNNCFCVLFVFSEHYFDKYIFVNLGSMSVNQLALAHVCTKRGKIIIYLSQKQNNWVPFVIEIDKDYVIYDHNNWPLEIEHKKKFSYNFTIYEILLSFQYQILLTSKWENHFHSILLHGTSITSKKLLNGFQMYQVVNLLYWMFLRNVIHKCEVSFECDVEAI